jgi:hypothetical protein
MYEVLKMGSVVVFQIQIPLFLFCSHTPSFSNCHNIHQKHLIVLEGKMYNITFNMYTSIKSCISYNNHTTGYFNCEIGVRQGENLFFFFFQYFLMI